MSNSAVDPSPGGPGLNFVTATAGNTTPCVDVNNFAAGFYTPFGADGYPAIDQVTGKVFQAMYSGSSILLNIGTPDATGTLTFLDVPTTAAPLCYDTSKLYDDTSNGLAQPGFTPNNNQTVDHAGAGVITVARQSSGPGCTVSRSPVLPTSPSPA